ncbi:hypothetical protein ACN47E_003914 [Coniothyrium glycines]
MQPLRTRQICRAHNRYNAATTLWQHFVATAPLTLPRQRLSSTAITHLDGRTETDSVASSAGATSTDPGTDPQVFGRSSGDAPSAIRKISMTTGKFFATKKEASIAKLSKQSSTSRSEDDNDDTARLLREARTAFKKNLEYGGVVVKPRVNTTPIRESMLPWCVKTKARQLAGMDRLNLEIENFYNYAVPGKFERIARKHLMEQVRRHVRQALPDYILESFGSERTGLAFATSDIDLRLVPSSQWEDPVVEKLPPKQQDRLRRFEALRNLYVKHIQHHKAYLLPSLRWARYPLISLQDRQTGIDVQIVLANDTSQSRAYIQGYLDEYAYLRQLFFVVKATLDVRGLSDVFRGGIGSYSLFMMLVASIKHSPQPPKDAASALLGFLKFYRDFPYHDKAISIEPVCLLDKVSEPILTSALKTKRESGELNPLPRYMLSLRDPADETNDLGRKGVAIKHIQATFKALHADLAWHLKINTRPSLLGSLVGPVYMLNKERRFRLDKYGRKVLLQVQAQAIRKAQEIVQGGDEVAPQIAEDGAEETAKEEAEQDRQAREEEDRGFPTTHGRVK